MSNDTPAREQVEAWLDATTRCRLHAETISPHRARVHCLLLGMTERVADVWCGPSGPHAPLLARLFAAAPTLARAYIATLDRAEAAERRVVELEAALAAERGEQAGAPSAGWAYRGRSVWRKGRTDVVRVGAGQYGIVPSGSLRVVGDWYLTARDAMKAADAARRAVTGRDT